MNCLACRPTGDLPIDRLPQHLAGRQVRHSQVLDQPLGLRPFSSAGRSKEN